MGWYDRLYVGPDARPSHIEGITCDAKNIIALSASETRCATFEPRGKITRR